MIIKQADSQNPAKKQIVRLMSFLRGRKISAAVSIYALSIALLAFSINWLYQGSDFAGKIKKHLCVENLKIPFNYLSGLCARPERLTIHIKHKDYEKIAYNRKIALERGFLLSDYRDEVPALIRYKDKLIKAKLRLKGRSFDHWIGDRWSFKIKLKDGNTIMGMRSFAIEHPGTREGMNEWYFKKLLEYNGLPFQRFDFIDVTINGKEKGIYAIEEDFGKLLIANNRLREGLIIEFQDEDFWKALVRGGGRPDEYSQKAYSAADIDAFELGKNPDPAQLEAFRKARDLLELFRSAKLSAHEVFDIKKTAKLLAITHLFGRTHAHEWVNVKFYYNPVTSMLEPIGSDVNWAEPLDHIRGSAVRHTRDDYYLTWGKRLFEDKIFFREYIGALEEVSDKVYLDNFFEKTDKEAKQKMRLLYRSYPWYRFTDKPVLYQNQEFIRKTLGPFKSLKAYSRGLMPEQRLYCLQLGNVSTLPVEVLGIWYKDSVLFAPIDETVLSGKDTLAPVDYRKADFRLPDDLAVSEIPLADLKVKYRIPGSSQIEYESVLTWPYTYDNLFTADLFRQGANIKDFEFLSVNEETKKIFFKSGEWNLEHSLIIPQGYEVIAGEGLKLNLSCSAKILTYSPLTFVGTQDNPISISSTDSTGQGIIVIRAPQKSFLEYVNFEGLSNPSQASWELTGSVTFYESPVSISNCKFSNNKRGDDYLNIIRSDFTMEKASFANTVSDAFDGDFIKGEISDSVFLNCGGDGIDFSGSDVTIRNTSISKAGDKGISIGEESQVSCRDIEIDQAKIGIASKDMSTADIRAAKISDCKVGLALYQKKPEFGPAAMTVAGLEMQGVENPYLVEEGSELDIEGQRVKTEQKALRETLEKLK